MVDVKKVFVQGEDGKTYTVDKQWMKQWLGICSLEHKVHDLEKPMRQERILNILKAEARPRSDNWLRRHIPEFEFRDLWDLERDGKVYYFMSGHHRMWQVVKVNE